MHTLERLLDFRKEDPDIRCPAAAESGWSRKERITAAGSSPRGKAVWYSFLSQHRIYHRFPGGGGAITCSQPACRCTSINLKLLKAGMGRWEAAIRSATGKNTKGVRGDRCTTHRSRGVVFRVLLLAVEREGEGEPRVDRSGPIPDFVVEALESKVWGGRVIR